MKTSSSSSSSSSCLLICEWICLSLFIDSIEPLQLNDRLMPDLPSMNNRSTSIDSSLTRQIYSFDGNRIRRLSIEGGPFDVKLYQNRENDSTNSSSSIDVQTDENLHSFVSIQIRTEDQLIIRTKENLRSMNKTNVHLVLWIHYKDFNEIYLDGNISLRCLNSIQSETFRLFTNQFTMIKLKLNLQIFSSFLHSIGQIKFCGYVHRQATIHSFGLAEIRAEHLLTRRLEVFSSGIGNVFVTSIEPMNITSTGLANVYYRGSLHYQMKTGLGQIIQLEDLQRFIDE